jgi:hypothetical protein
MHPGPELVPSCGRITKEDAKKHICMIVLAQMPEDPTCLDLRNSTSRACMSMQTRILRHIRSDRVEVQCTTIIIP